MQQKRYVFTFNESTSQSVNTKPITGKLLCFITKTNHPVRISIYLAKYPEICLYENVELKGTQYLSLKTDDITDHHQKYNFTNSHWHLFDDPLTIKISGKIGTIVEILCRYE